CPGVRCFRSHASLHSLPCGHTRSRNDLVLEGKLPQAGGAENGSLVTAVPARRRRDPGSGRLVKPPPLLGSELEPDTGERLVELVDGADAHDRRHGRLASGQPAEHHLVTRGSSARGTWTGPRSRTPGLAASQRPITVSL